jgi:hypothetical protein
MVCDLWFMVFNTTFNNISATLWLSYLLVEETGVPVQLHVQSVPITNKVVSLNPVHGEVYLIQHYVIKFVSDLRQVGIFLRVLLFPPPPITTGKKEAIIVRNTLPYNGSLTGVCYDICFNLIGRRRLTVKITC